MNGMMFPRARVRRRRRDESQLRLPGRGSEGANVQWRLRDRGGSKVRPIGRDEIPCDGLSGRGRSRVGQRRSFRDLFRDSRDETSLDGRSRRGSSQVGHRRRLHNLPKDSRSLRLINFQPRSRRSDGDWPPSRQRIREGGKAHPRRGSDTMEASRGYQGDGGMARTTFR